MKPRADDDEDMALFLGSGTVHDLNSDEEEQSHHARLYIPDPEARRGWREHYVRPVRTQRAQARVLGFRPR